jgi:GH35 family endo-1,4-beta-xylanase
MLTAGNGLQAQYFNTTELSTPALVRIDPTINFNWAAGSPSGSIGSNTFSARWSGEIESQFTETYSFIVNANDGARLWVNGQLLIDEFESGSISDQTASIDLIAGRRYDIQLEYRENTGNASVSLEWSSDSLAREVVPQSRLYASDRGTLTAERWNGVSGANVSNLTADPDFPSSPDSATSLTSFEATSNAGTDFGQRIHGHVHAPTTGPYTFFIAADASAELWLSNTSSDSEKLLIASVDSATTPQEWDASATQRSATVYLVAGQDYYIEALHKESSGADHLAVGWIQPGTDNIEVISGEHLSPVRATVEIFSDTPFVAEDSSSPAKFTVTRTGPTTNALDVSFATFGDATEGVDFENTGGEITIPAGQSSVTIEISALTDSATEGEESLNVEILAGPGYDVGYKSQRTAYGTLQDDAAAPSGGTDLWDGVALSDFTFFGGNYTTQSDPTYGNVIQSDISTQHANPWNAQLKQNIDSPVSEGDVLFVEFRARSIGGPGELSAIFEENTSPFTKSLDQGIAIQEQWSKIQLPFVSLDSYAAGEASFGFHLGHAQQTLQFTGFEVINYGPQRAISPDTSFFLNSINGSWGTSQYVPVTGQSFDTAFEVETTTVPPQFWNLQAVDINDSPVANGDTMRFEFYIRATNGASPEVNLAVQRTDTYANLLSENITPTSEWVAYSFDVPVAENFAAGGLQAVVNVGYGLQTIEIGEFSWSNLSNALNIEDLPTRSPGADYSGRAGTDTWRDSADQRIEDDRKSSVTVTVTDANGEPVDGAIVSLRQTNHEFLFGSAINAFNGKLDANGNATAQKYQSEINRLFNAAVLENSVKWRSYIQDPQRALDATQFAIDNDLYLRGHNFIWPSRQFMPTSVWTEYDNRVANDGTSSANAWLTATIEDRFDEVLTTFDGLVPEWDVVNEPWSNHDVMDLLGDNILVDWYQQVRDFDPTIKLALNDFGIFANNGNNTGHRDNFEYWLGLLNDDGLLDIIGEQSHYSDSNLTDITVLESLLNTYNTQFNASIAITEFDVDTKDEQLQADYLRDYMTMAFSQTAVTEFLHWGFWESSHWLPDAALYRSDFSIKPNGQAYEDLVFGEWWTDLQATTRNGAITTDAFRGEYDVIVEYDGQTYNATVTVDDSGNSTVNIELPVTKLNYDPILDRDIANIAGAVATDLVNTGTWFEPDQQTLNLTASHGDVTLNADGTWDWSYSPAQTYFGETITITGQDSDGATSQTTFSISTFDLAVNGAQVQRSTVNSLVLTFDGSVEIDPDAFTVVQRSDATGAATGIPVAASFSCVKNGDTIVTLEFDSSTRNNFGALEDGNYQLTVDGSKVRRLGTNLTLGADYVYGDSVDEPFFALYGDNNGDRRVNVFDLLGFRQTYLASASDANYNLNFDYSGDGVVNVFDLLKFRQNYLKTLAFV